MTFYTPPGRPITLDEVEAVAIRPLLRPDPAEDMRGPDDRDQAARELLHFTQFPFEVQISHLDGEDRFLYGNEARDFLAGWFQQFRPWIR